VWSSIFRKLWALQNDVWQGSLFFRKGNILISQLLHRPMHIAISYYRIIEFQDLVVSSKLEVSHTSSGCQSERLFAPETVAAVRDCLLPNHVGQLGNSNLLATIFHAGLLANFVVTTSGRSYQTVGLHCQADAKPSNRCVTALLLTTFLRRGHYKLESSTKPPPSSPRR
jgi:hypothetical protein